MLKRHSKSIITIIVLISMLFTITMYWNNGGAYAEDKPDATLYIHGEKSRGGPIFNGTGNMAGGLWAPGVTSSGIMRIRNNYSDRIRVTNLGLSMTLEKLEGQEYKPVTNQNLFETFAKNMELTIKKGKSLIFNSTIYDESFFEMLYKQGNNAYTGFDLSTLDRFNISEDDYIDLEYTVHMKEEAGNDLQGLRATVAFLINVQENPEPYTPPKKDDNKEQDLIEEPIETIPDIEGHWAHDCIMTLLEKGIIIGYEDGTIRPENYITRAEAAVLIAKALDIVSTGREESIYKDSIPDWAESYIAVLTEQGILKGYTDNTFKPNQNITREEMTSVLIKAFEIISQEESEFELEFIDSNLIGYWALDDIRLGVQEDVISGYPDNTFKPKDNITRAEAFTLICKLLGFHDEHSNEEEVKAFE